MTASPPKKLVASLLVTPKRQAKAEARVVRPIRA